LLLSRVAGVVDVRDLAFDHERVIDFQRELGAGSKAPNSTFAWQLVLGSIRASFASGLSNESPSRDLNAKIASSILACFSQNLFDTTGRIKSAWMHRLERISDDTQGMIDQLMRAEQEFTEAPQAETREYRNDGAHGTPQRRFPRN
jgi:hypothetical protein